MAFFASWLCTPGPWPDLLRSKTTLAWYFLRGKRWKPVIVCSDFLQPIKNWLNSSGIKKMLFKIRSKHHFLWHQAWQVRMYRLNQNLHTCWGDESFLGRLKKVGRLCHGKTMATTRVFERYILGFALHLQEIKGRSR